VFFSVKLLPMLGRAAGRSHAHAAAEAREKEHAEMILHRREREEGTRQVVFGSESWFAASVGGQSLSSVVGRELTYMCFVASRRESQLRAQN